MAKLIIPPRIGRVEIEMGKFNPRKAKMFAIDTETTGLDPWGEYGVDREVWPCRPFAFSMCDYEGNMAYVRWMIDPRNRRVIRNNKSFGLLQDLLYDPTLSKIFHNYQFDNHMLVESGFKIRGECHDTLIRMHVLNPAEHSYGLKPLSIKYLGISDDDQKDLTRSVAAGRRYARKNGWPVGDDTKADYALGCPEACRKYAELDAYRTMALFQAQETEFDRRPSLRNVYKREKKLMRVIESMESKGVRIDGKRTNEVINFYEKIQDDSTNIIAESTPEGFNPRSPKQMTGLFFGELGHTPQQYSRKGKSKVYTDCMHCKGEGCKVCQNTGRNPKCGGDFLVSIALSHNDDGSVKVNDELAHNLLMNSAATTMLGYTKSYLKYSTKTRDGRIVHPNYKQAGPITGRFSAHHPNLQNVASDDSGKKKVDIPYRPRECFIPRKGCRFLIPDFSQIEVWVLALLAKDWKFVDELAKGGDAHQIVADMANLVQYDRGAARVAEQKLAAGEKPTTREMKALKLRKMDRKINKALNFGITYGQGAELTATALGRTTAEAKKFKAQYFEIFPAVQKFMRSSMKAAQADGYVVNPYGREYPIQRGLEYRACNYLIQGSSADLLKNGMIATHDLCQKKKYRGKLDQLLTIHDELLIEEDKKIHSEKVMKDIALAMAVDYKFLGAPIPFPIGMKIADERWSESYEIAV